MGKPNNLSAGTADLCNADELNVLLKGVQQLADHNLQEWTEALGRLMKAYYADPDTYAHLRSDIEMVSALSSFFILVTDCEKVIEGNVINTD